MFCFLDNKNRNPLLKKLSMLWHKPVIWNAAPVCPSTPVSVFNELSRQLLPQRALNVCCHEHWWAGAGSTFNKTIPLISLGYSHVGGRGALLHLSRPCFLFFSPTLWEFIISSLEMCLTDRQRASVWPSRVSLLLQPYNPGLHFTLKMNDKEMLNFLEECKQIAGCWGN